MKRPAKDAEREERIQMEIIVDAYGPEEQIMGWLSYLDEHLHVPFTARCIAPHATSPLKVSALSVLSALGTKEGQACFLSPCLERFEEEQEVLRAKIFADAKMANIVVFSLILPLLSMACGEGTRGTTIEPERAARTD